MNRVEKHIIKPNNKYYNLLDEFCYKSKIYIIMQIILLDKNLLIMENG